MSGLLLSAAAPLAAAACAAAVDAAAVRAAAVAQDAYQICQNRVAIEPKMPYVSPGSPAHGALGGDKGVKAMRRFLIKTKSLGPTNTLGTRIRASSPGYKPVTASYDYARSFKENCRAVAEAFLLKNSVNWALDGDPIDDGSACIFWIAVES